MKICCLDMEGVLVPEIWINVAKKTKIDELKLTTRDEPDYDVLMKRRIAILHQHKIKLIDIQRVIATMKPLPGAKAFLDKLRSERQVIILSDTFYQFAMPLMEKLGYPTLFCNWLETDEKGYIDNYILRQKNGKQKAVEGLNKIGFSVAAVGDSYNDLTMLLNSQKGILFNPPPMIEKDYPKLPVARDYKTLLKMLLAPEKKISC